MKNNLNERLENLDSFAFSTEQLEIIVPAMKLYNQLMLTEMTELDKNAKLKLFDDIKTVENTILKIVNTVEAKIKYTREIENILKNEKIFFIQQVNDDLYFAFIEYKNWKTNTGIEAIRFYIDYEKKLTRHSPSTVFHS